MIREIENGLKAIIERIVESKLLPSPDGIEKKYMFLLDIFLLKMRVM